MQKNEDFYEEDLFKDISMENVIFTEYKVLKDTKKNRFCYIIFILCICFILSCICVAGECAFFHFSYPSLYFNIGITTIVWFSLHFYFHILPTYYEWRHYMR